MIKRMATYKNRRQCVCMKWIVSQTYLDFEPYKYMGKHIMKINITIIQIGKSQTIGWKRHIYYIHKKFGISVLSTINMFINQCFYEGPYFIKFYILFYTFIAPAVQPVVSTFKEYHISISIWLISYITWYFKLYAYNKKIAGSCHTS